MPAGDRTGPAGAGPRSGRGLGYCSGYNSPGYTKGVPRGGAGYGFGRGPGYGAGGRRGRGHYGWGARGYYPPANPAEGAPSGYTEQLNEEDRKEVLKDETEELKRRLEDIERELDNLE